MQQVCKFALIVKQEHEAVLHAFNRYQWLGHHEMSLPTVIFFVTDKKSSCKKAVNREKNLCRRPSKRSDRQ
ncbi:hypothetical protein [Paenibacillus popilliae]|uniref:hypothetical protein n=1 Tax=Paenibacillus popilliae TaxID=78057 RepID=UPI003BF5D10C